MKLYVDVVRNQELNREIDWPDGWRVPVAGEWIRIDPHPDDEDGHVGHLVHSVTWEFNQSESPDGPAVHLRVSV